MNLPYVFTGQPTVAPGIIQHHSSAPTSTPGETAATATGLQLADVVPSRVPLWLKIAAGVLLLGGVVTVAVVAANKHADRADDEY